MATDGEVRLSVEAGIARVVFDRPQARNAMTWAMYEALVDVCDRLRADASVRVATFRGAGGQAFVAGTDITQFTSFASGDDGVAYERRIDACIQAVATLPMPTVAVVEGYAVGGGLALATACDFRVATPSARFGVPIARTVGNCLSMANIAALVAAFGTQRARRMLLLAEIVDADEALACGFLHAIHAPDTIEGAASGLCDALAQLAPTTQRVSKEALRRLTLAGLPDADDLIREAYGSEGFRQKVAAFIAKRSESPS
jgi:enoyl-CoA hydratase/carnithine racemase